MSAPASARWHGFRDTRLRERVLEWLESEDVEPVLD